MKDWMGILLTIIIGLLCLPGCGGKKIARNSNQTANTTIVDDIDAVLKGKNMIIHNQTEQLRKLLKDQDFESPVTENANNEELERIIREQAELIRKLTEKKESTMVQFPNIFFKFNSYSIDDSDAAGLLYGVLDVLLSYRDIQVVLVGHADDRGTRTYNLALALNRAKAVERFLTKRGIDADRFSLISMGEDDPQCKDSRTESCHAQNRVVVLEVK